MLSWLESFVTGQEDGEADGVLKQQGRYQFLHHFLEDVFRNMLTLNVW
jgi:hypothetical protein